MLRFIPLVLLAQGFAAAAAAPPDGGIIPLPLNPVVPAAQRICAARTASGLGYTQLRAGAGAKPTAADVVLVNYVGYLAATGAVFDQGMSSPLPVGGVIPGFAEGLQLTGKTGIVRLCVPAALGYGASGAGRSRPAPTWCSRSRSPISRARPSLKR